MKNGHWGRGVQPQITGSPPHRPEMKNVCQRESTCRQRQRRCTFPLPITTGAAHFGHPLFLHTTTNHHGLTHHSLHTPNLYTLPISTDPHSLDTPLPYIVQTNSHDGRTYHSLHTPNIYILFRYQSRRGHTLCTPLSSTNLHGRKLFFFFRHPLTLYIHQYTQLCSVNGFRLFV